MNEEHQALGIGRTCFIDIRVLHPFYRILLTLDVLVCWNGLACSFEMTKQQILSQLGIVNYAEYEVRLLEENSNQRLYGDQLMSDFMPLNESSCLVFNQRYIQETLRQDDDHSLVAQDFHGGRRRRVGMREATVDVTVLNPLTNRLELCQIALCWGGVACTVAQTKEFLLRTISIFHNFDRYHLAVHVTNVSFLLDNNDLTFPYMYIDDAGFYLSLTFDHL